MKILSKFKIVSLKQIAQQTNRKEKREFKIMTKFMFKTWCLEMKVILKLQVSNLLMIHLMCLEIESFYMNQIKDEPNENERKMKRKAGV